MIKSVILARLRPTVLIITTITLALVVLSSHGGEPLEADSFYNNDIHPFTIKDTQGGYNYTGNVESSAGTISDNNGSVLAMFSHSNAASVVNGKCGGPGGYPFCWGPINTPRIRYYHSSNSYTLSSGWYDNTQNCLFRVDDHGNCFNNDTDLGWSTWPVNADGYRNVPIHADDSSQYTYIWPCCGVYMAPHTDEYQVY